MAALLAQYHLCTENYRAVPDAPAAQLTMMLVVCTSATEHHHTITMTNCKDQSANMHKFFNHHKYKHRMQCAFTVIYCICFEKCLHF